jgi:hypothetical protein
MQTQDQGVSGKNSQRGMGQGASATPTLNQYMSVGLTITGTTAGPAINVYLKPKNGYPAVWSMGDGDDSSNGLLVQMNTSGALPLSSINITEGDATFQTIAGSGGNSWSFQCNLYVAGEQELNGFTLSLIADPSVTVTASINNSKPYTLGSAAESFDWKPLQQ